jgi:dTDP-4-dehydrorhamnose reductase
LASMRVAIIGSKGQLATELHGQSWGPGLGLTEHEALDVTKRDAVFASLDRRHPDLVVNASAYTAVDRAETEREEAFAVNESGPRWLAEWCARNGSALVHVSTDYVFDGRSGSEYSETDTPNPQNVYGASKLAGERQVQHALDRHVIMRTSWLFSAHGHNFVKTMLRLARERDELRVVADQFGRPTAARSLAAAVVAVGSAIRQKLPVFGTLHYAGTGAASWHEFATAIVDQQAKLTGCRPRVIPIATDAFPTAARRPARSVLATGRFQGFFGAPEPWLPGLTEVVAASLSGANLLG